MLEEQHGVVKDGSSNVLAAGVQLDCRAWQVVCVQVLTLHVLHKHLSASSNLSARQAHL